MPDSDRDWWVEKIEKFRKDGLTHAAFDYAATARRCYPGDSEFETQLYKAAVSLDKGEWTKIADTIINATKPLQNNK